MNPLKQVTAVEKTVFRSQYVFVCMDEQRIPLGRESRGFPPSKFSLQALGDLNRLHQMKLAVFSHTKVFFIIARRTNCCPIKKLNLFNSCDNMNHYVL